MPVRLAPTTDPRTPEDHLEEMDAKQSFRDPNALAPNVRHGPRWALWTSCLHGDVDILQEISGEEDASSAIAELLANKSEGWEWLRNRGFSREALTRHYRTTEGMGASMLYVIGEPSIITGLESLGDGDAHLGIERLMRAFLISPEDASPLNYQRPPYQGRFA